MLRNNPGSSSGSRFEFIKRLNVDNGGMNAGIAVVRDRKNGKLCIEKRLDPDCIRTRLADMEIEALQQLDHPNVNRIIDVFVDYNLLQGSIFLEMCDGGSLDKLIGRHSVDGRSIGESQIWRWFIQLAKAVAYCHCGPSLNDREARSLWNAVYHRDIKPANVFLSRIENGTQDGEVILKLGDFGCAISACLIENGVVDPRFASRYTPEFAPPEAPLLNKKSDVYQVGGVMACLCRLKQTWQHFDKDQAAGEEYSSKLNMAIRYCMKSNYQERIGAAALVKRLESTFEGKSGSLEPDQLLILPRRAERRRNREHGRERGRERDRERDRGRGEEQRGGMGDGDHDGGRHRAFGGRRR